MATNPTFWWSDAWLFLGTAMAAQEGPASLARILQVADAIEYAVPTFAEADGGLGRLALAGYLKRSADGFQLTTEGRRIVEAAQASAQVLVRQQEALAARLEAIPWSRDYHPNLAGRAPSVPPVIDAEEYASARRGPARD